MEISKARDKGSETMNGERKRSSKGWKIARKVLLLAVILALVAVGVLWLKDLILSRQAELIYTQEGVLESSMEVDALVANTEQVLTTPTAGSLDKLFTQGDRIRKGTVVAKILAQNTGGKIELTSPTSGLINYNIDGQEGVVTAKNLLEWGFEKFEGINPAPAGTETFSSGQGVLKITDNLMPTYLFFKLAKPGLKVSQGDSLALQIEQQRVNVKVMRVAPEGPEKGIVVASNSFLPQSLGKRRLKLGWLDKNAEKGQLMPVAALIERQGAKGVYILKDGVVTWQAVTILNQNQEQACVKGLKTGTPVISTPNYVHEGQIISNS